MPRKSILFLQVIVILTLNTCMLSKSLILDNSPPSTVWDPDFETGLVFKSCRQNSLVIRQGPQVTIREFLTRDIIYRGEVDWHTNTSIPLDPGKYIIDFHVNYLGVHIWKHKGFFVVDDGAPTHLILDTPWLITSKPKVVFR